MTGTTSFGPT